MFAGEAAGAQRVEGGQQGQGSADDPATAEEPGTAVSRPATRPPVQDSAAAIFLDVAT